MWDGVSRAHRVAAGVGVCGRVWTDVGQGEQGAESSLLYLQL